MSTLNPIELPSASPCQDQAKPRSRHLAAEKMRVRRQFESTGSLEVLVRITCFRLSKKQ